MRKSTLANCTLMRPKEMITDSEELETLEFQYVVGIQTSTSVWPPGTAPLPPRARNAMGRPASFCAEISSICRCRWKELAFSVSRPGDWRRVSWREGTRGTMHSFYPPARACSPSRLLAQ